MLVPLKDVPVNRSFVHPESGLPFRKCATDKKASQVLAISLTDGSYWHGEGKCLVDLLPGKVDEAGDESVVPS